MSWFRSFGIQEWVWVGVFLLGYGVYFWRIFKIGWQLNTPVGTVFIKLVVRSLFFALLITAFLGPVVGDAQREVKSVGKDILLCVDLSKSMDARDIAPTRLEKIKFELKRIVSEFNSDRLGVIIFSSEAFMQSPLTYDQNALNLFIEALNTNLVPTSSTDFGPPLEMALNKLQTDEGRQVQQKSKVIILISDGEDFGEQTDEAVQKINDADIKVFTLGVGTEQGAQINTGKGVPALTRLVATHLKEVAEKSGGQYFEINDNRNDVNRLITAINNIEGELRDTRVIDVSANRYHLLLLPALLLLLFDIFVNVKTVRI